jgi:hypothetical protein
MKSRIIIVHANMERGTDMKIKTAHGGSWAGNVESCRSSRKKQSGRNEFGGFRPRKEMQPTACVIRGGSWNFAARLCRSASRFRFRPGYRVINLGFRLVMKGDKNVLEQ